MPGKSSRPCERNSLIRESSCTRQVLILIFAFLPDEDAMGHLTLLYGAREEEDGEDSRSYSHDPRKNAVIIPTMSPM